MVLIVTGAWHGSIPSDTDPIQSGPKNPIALNPAHTAHSPQQFNIFFSSLRGGFAVHRASQTLKEPCAACTAKDLNFELNFFNLT